DDRQGDAFGLTGFGDHFIHWVPLTDDTTALAHAPPFLNPKRLPRWFSQGTSIGKALRECRKLMIQREEGDRLIILLSDGYSFDLSNGEDERLARTFRDDRITVHAVHIGPGSPPDPLVNMTARTGGEVFAAGDPEGLSAVFRQIDAMQKTRMIKVSAETMDHFKPFAEAALYCMASVLLASFGLRYIPW
ncbi:MAG TPA: aerotolerance regulator BatA, partial [Verrucomicrobiales bacterium]|nr:aerotolerance regulator BatA [Verrucomicrobiales bacterium]